MPQKPFGCFWPTCGPSEEVLKLTFCFISLKPILSNDLQVTGMMQTKFEIAEECGSFCIKYLGVLQIWPQILAMPFTDDQQKISGLEPSKRKYEDPCWSWSLLKQLSSDCSYPSGPSGRSTFNAQTKKPGVKSQNCELPRIHGCVYQMPWPQTAVQLCKLLLNHNQWRRLHVRWCSLEEVP